MKRYLKMATPYKGALILTVLALLGSSVVSLVMPDAVRRLTGALTDGTATKERVLVFAAVILLSYIVKALLTFVSKYKAHVAAWNFVGDMMLDVYNKLQSLSMRFFGDKQTGEIMSRVINDSRNMETLIAHALPDLLSNILIVIMVAIMIFSINPILAAISLIPIPLILFVTMKFSGKVHALFKRNQEVLAEVNGKVQDNISGIREIQSFGREAEEYMSMKEYCKRYSFANVRANFVASIFFPTIEFLTSVGSVLVMGIGGTLALKDVLSVSDVVGFFMYLSLFYSPIAALSRIIEDMQNAFAGGHRVLSILDMESEIKDSENAENIGRANGDIEFDHVSFYYNENEPVLKDISFKVESGKMVAFVGATGVGKSTIVSLMERFYDPVSGSVRLDGKDIRDITVKSLRENISMVLQDVFLFNGSIYDNIAYGNPSASHDEIVKAAETARVNDFVCKMPDGYDTIIGERGVRLSGGQKQRIAIARAVLKNSPILILDEATSAVDNETEALIQQAIDELSKSRTVIVIAHRLSTVMKADNIIVLENGRIAEQGTHNELLKLGGIYAKLCNVNSDRIKAEM
ncbi:MAG TPA: ABC transporter ATP-binding protein/permease [Oscillospiraceae bacterium]|nr:ABC transporter ATP-binding protein/permease [Oscillospiraceae bacterium]